MNNNECLSYESFICSQLWTVITPNVSCANFSGIYGMQWIAKCNNDTICALYDDDTVSLSTDLKYQDNKCENNIFQIQFQSQMSFYTNDSFIGNVKNDHAFIIGQETIYVELTVNYPSNLYSIFDSKLLNVWLCTIDDQQINNFTVSQTDPTSSGCLSSIIDKYNPFWIIQNHDENLKHSAMHHFHNMSNNVIRFSFIVPSNIKREVLWIQTQIQISLINYNNNQTKRMLFDISSSSTTDFIRHFIASTNVVQHSIKSADINNQNSDNSLFYVIITLCIAVILLILITIFVVLRLIKKQKQKHIANNDDTKNYDRVQTNIQLQLCE